MSTTIPVLFRHTDHNMIAVIGPFRQFTVYGDNPCLVTADELNDMIEGHVPKGWMRELPWQKKDYEMTHHLAYRGMPMEADDSD